MPIVSVGPNTTGHLDTPLAPATAYTHRVRARNAGGASGYVELAVQTAALPVPSAPRNLVATALAFDRVRLAWTDTSDCEAAFVVERRVPPSATWSDVAGGTLPQGTQEWTDTGLQQETTYAYRVRAVNAAGQATSGEASATTPEKIDGPDYLAVYPTGAQSMRLVWSSTPGATAYRVCRSLIEDVPVAPGNLAGTVGATTENFGVYDDFGLLPGLEYYYKVTALTSAGESVASDIDSALGSVDAIPWYASPNVVLPACQSLANSLIQGSPILEEHVVAVTPMNTAMSPEEADSYPTRLFIDVGLSMMHVDAIWTPLLLDGISRDSQGAYYKNIVYREGKSTNSTLGARVMFGLPDRTSMNLVAGESTHAYVGFSSGDRAHRQRSCEAGVMFSPAKTFPPGSPNEGFWPDRYGAYLRMSDGRKPENEYTSHISNRGFGVNANPASPRLYANGRCLAQVAMVVDLRTKTVHFKVVGSNSFGQTVFVQTYVAAFNPDKAEPDNVFNGPKVFYKPELRYVVSLAQSVHPPTGARFFSNPPPDNWPKRYIANGSWVNAVTIQDPEYLIDGAAHSWREDVAPGWRYHDRWESFHPYEAGPCVSVTRTGGISPTDVVTIRHD